jgi:hypothetical protein
VARTAHSPSSSGGTSHSSRHLCRNVDESIEELRQIADGRNDILAEAAGITAGSWDASPATHVGYEADRAGMLIAAGDGRGCRWPMTSCSAGPGLATSVVRDHVRATAELAEGG